MTSQLSLCAQEVRKTEHDQFLCGLFAPEEHQNGFFAMQLFLMETTRIRDLVSEPHLGLIRLQWWRDLVDNIYAGHQGELAEQGTHLEIAQTLVDKKIDQALFNRYFNARSFDMEDRAHDDMDALLRYAQATGGTFAQIKESAIGFTPSEAALKIGTAQALYALIRTLAHQSRTQRCKIPLSLVRKHKLDIKSFVGFTATPALKACVGEIANHITRLIAEARALKQESNAVLLSSVAMEDYLKRLSKVDNDPFNPNIGQGRLSKQIKLAIKVWRKKY